MPRFRKRPIELTAEQWFPGVQLPGLSNAHGGEAHRYAYVATLEGLAFVRPGDWVVTGVRGERWPVRDDVFRETYEEVAEDG